MCCHLATPCPTPSPRLDCLRGGALFSNFPAEQAPLAQPPCASPWTSRGSCPPAPISLARMHTATPLLSRACSYCPHRRAGASRPALAAAPASVPLPQHPGPLASQLTALPGWTGRLGSSHYPDSQIRAALSRLRSTCWPSFVQVVVFQSAPAFVRGPVRHVLRAIRVGFKHIIAHRSQAAPSRLAVDCTGKCRKLGAKAR